MVPNNVPHWFVAKRFEDDHEHVDADLRRRLRGCGRHGFGLLLSAVEVRKRPSFFILLGPDFGGHGHF